MQVHVIHIHLYHMKLYASREVSADAQQPLGSRVMNQMKLFIDILS